MNEQVEMKGANASVIVVLHPACKISRDDILALLRELGLSTSEITFLEPDQVGECGDLNNKSIIIPIDDTTYDLPELVETGRCCGDGGGRVIVLCGPGYSYEGVHPVADKYGTQCGWSPDQLKARISGQTDELCSSSGVRKRRTGASQVDC